MRKDNQGKRTKIIIVLALTFIMVSSVFGFIFSYRDTEEGSNVINYKDKKFQLINNLWVTEIDGVQVFVLNDPNTLESIDVPTLPLQHGKIYVGLPPGNTTSEEYDFVSQRMTYTLGLRNVNAVPACSYDDIDCPDVPIIDCQKNIPSIVFVESNLTSVYEQESCIIVEGDFIYLDMFIDKLTLELVGL